MHPGLSWSRSPRAIKTRLDDDTMRFGLAWPYAPTTLPSTAFEAGNDPLDVGLQTRLAQAAESAGFDFAFLADGYVPGTDEARKVHYRETWPAPYLWAIPIFLATRSIGVVTTLHTTYIPPAHIARFGAQLDWISQGRWGWNVVTGYREEEATLFGLEGLPSHDARYEAAEEAIHIVDAMWAAGAEAVDYVGKHYRARGRLAGPKPMQDSPLRIQAGVSNAGRNFAAKYCDYLLAPLRTFAEYGSVAEDMAQRGVAAGRIGTPCVPLLPWLVHVHRDGRRAQQEFDAFAETIHFPAMDAGAADMKKGSQSGGGTSETMVRRDGIVALVGGVDEVAEQLIVAHREHGVKGMVIALILWGVESASQVGAVFDVLHRAGVWLRPQERNFSW